MKRRGSEKDTVSKMPEKIKPRSDGAGWGAGQPGALRPIRGVDGRGTTAAGDVSSTESGGDAARGRA